MDTVSLDQGLLRTTAPNGLVVLTESLPGVRSAAVGIYVPGQIADYYAHRSGLSGHAADNTWHPDDIDSTIFDFAEWERDLEDDMAYTDWPEKDRKALVADVREAFAAELDKPEKVNDGGNDKRRSLRQMVKESWQKRNT